MSFTTKADVWEFEATMESEHGANEEALFSNVQETRATFSSANHTPGGNEAAELKSSQPIGPALSLHVFPGDTVSMEVYAYYEGGNGYSSTSALGTFIGAVAGAFGGLNGGTEAQQATFDAFDNTLGTLGLNGTSSDNVPAAYLNYILFDKHLNYKASGFTQISTAANMNHERLGFADLVMEHEGLLYIYASHESANGRTFFDDMKVTYAEGPIVSTNTFFPNGGQIEALSFQRPSSPINRFKFIDRELVDDYGIEIYDHLARNYDPWWGAGYLQIDPLGEMTPDWTSYRYGYDNPLRYSDPTGMSEVDENGNFKYTDEDEIKNVLAGLQKRFGNNQNTDGKDDDQESSGDEQDGEFSVKKANLDSKEGGIQVIENLRSLYAYYKNNPDAKRDKELEDLVEIDNADFSSGVNGMRIAGKTYELNGIEFKFRFFGDGQIFGAGRVPFIKRLFNGKQSTGQWNGVGGAEIQLNWGPVQVYYLINDRSEAKQFLKAQRYLQEVRNYIKGNTSVKIENR